MPLSHPHEHSPNKWCMCVLDKYIDGDFESPNYFPEEDLANNSYEGALKRVLVNKYERSSVARQKCIEYHGCVCSICGFDFEKVYGDLGKGFIHIHHIVPLNKINKEYKVNYKTDLIPVCPNCHAMLHRKINNQEIGINNLKEIVKKHNKKRSQ